ncbi:hypothetical protein [Marinoscillum sp. MHG1-6]|uniref:hypothetical protein n=1 Tax=Marinoscillum sp. MHG1-6 TaxID=2959627 RepID=UPI002157D968|nr:hypothetical protein [Marinoscillum sp. MHG1-6]
MKMLDEFWFQLCSMLGSGFFALCLLNILTYYVGLMGVKTRSEKYRLASQKEANTFARSSNFLAIGISFFSFVLIGKAIGMVEPYIYYFVGFFSIMIGFAIGYGMWAYLKYFYPFILEKHLNHIRFKPMKSPKDGRPMKLLNENEEDVHMTQEMIEEEDSMTVDYDVWIDEVTDYKIIERYDTYYHALVCDKCNFRTLKEDKEEVIKEPSAKEQGLLMKHFRCSYCGHQESKQVKVPSWEEEMAFSKVEKDVV